MTQENPFKKINQDAQKAPPHLKEKVMADVARVKLMMEVSVFFTENYAEAITSFFKNK